MRRIGRVELKRALVADYRFAEIVVAEVGVAEIVVGVRAHAIFGNAAGV